MLEFVMCIPLLALVISATFFFGWAMRNQQRVHLAGRYAAWRLVHNDKADHDGETEAYIYYSEPDQTSERESFMERYNIANKVTVDASRVGDVLLGSRAKDVSLVNSGGDSSVPEELTEEASQQNTDAGELARNSVLGDFAGSRRINISSGFGTDMKLWNKFATKDIQYNYQRDGTGWRRWQASYLDSIAEQFLFELEETVEGVGDSQLQENLQNLYRRDW